MKRLFLPILCMAAMPAYADTAAMNVAIDGVRKSCGGLSEQLTHLKTMAGINTAVTGVGTGVGAGALAAGIVKSNVDETINAALLVIEDEKKFYQEVAEYAEYLKVQNATTKEDQVTALNEKSNKLGNVRTGLMAANTATNIAGAVIAGTNQVKDELETQIGQCILAVNNLKNIYMQERIQPEADQGQLLRAEKIVSACGAWETADIKSVNKRARGAAVTAGIGAGVGLAGTVTSGMANSDPVRSATGDDAAQKEDNLNKASNILAGGATVMSATSTIFNATQIAAVKRVVEVAENCEGSLK